MQRLAAVTVRWLRHLQRLQEWRLRMSQETNAGYFLPLASNKAIENYEPQHAHKASKGAFSDEARDALATAVKSKKATVVMDNFTMEIKYYPEYVHVIANNSGRLPCGNFNRDILASRLEAE
jgi:hypothetical protein